METSANSCPVHEFIHADYIIGYCAQCLHRDKVNRIIKFSRIGLVLAVLAFLICTVAMY